MTPTISIILSVYNQFDRLEKVFAGLEHQKFTDFEIIVSDDGSSDEFLTKLNNYAQASPLTIKHVWHEDKGFRKTTILNKSVQAATADYLLFLDGDCVPHPRFLEEHIRNREPNTIVTGRRVFLSPKLTDWLTLEKIREGIHGSSGFMLKILADSVWGETIQAEKSLYKRNLPFGFLLKEKYKGILGCNFSLYKQELLEINGFDERYRAPAIGEDTDLQYRFAMLNKKFKPITYYALQYHLYHKQQARPQINKDIMQTVIDAGKPWTEYGIQKSEAAQAYLKTLSPTN
jgi:glycosyltransferase involved in cell wall biosynthesis